MNTIMKFDTIAGLLIALSVLFRAHAEDSMDVRFTKMELENKEIKQENEEIKMTLRKLNNQMAKLEEEKSYEASENMYTEHLPFVSSRSMCYSSGREFRVRTSPLPDDNGPSDDTDNKKIIFDLGSQHILFGESLLVEVTASVIAAILGDADYYDDDELDGLAGSLLRVLLNDYIRPKPESELPLKFITRYHRNGDDSEDYEYDYTEFIDSSTNTVKFFFPDLPVGRYKVKMEILLRAENFERYDFASFELGPHIVEIKKFKSDNSVCRVSRVLDDDEDALEGFDEDFPYEQVFTDSGSFAMMELNQTDELKFIRKKKNNGKN